MESSDFLNGKISTEQVQIKIKNSIIIITEPMQMFLHEFFWCENC